MPVPEKTFLQPTLRQVCREARQPGALPRSSAEDIPYICHPLCQAVLVESFHGLGSNNQQTALSLFSCDQFEKPPDLSMAIRFC